MILFFQNLFKEATLRLLQREKGYRSALDPVLLANFITAEKNDRVIDLGTGNGIIAILTALNYPKTRVTGIDIQDGLVELAEKNVAINGLEKRVEIKKLDIRKVASHLKAESFDMAVGNPPYRKLERGRLNPDREKALARHEIEITLEEYLKASKYLVKNRGKVVLIYHPSRFTELIGLFERLNIRTSRIQFIHSKKDTEATMVMVEGIKNGKNDTTVLKPLIVYERTGKYSKEVKEIFKKIGF